MKAYIFDLDGTLLDSMGVWEQIDIDFLAGRGIQVPDDYIQAIASMSFPEVARYTIRRFGFPDTEEELMQIWNDMAIYAYGHTVSLKPHAFAYLQKLKDRGAKLAVATSLPKELHEPALRNLGLGEMFEVICTTDQVPRGKAYPDIYLLTAQRLGVDPADCVVFEDIFEAVCGAKAAGMTVYGVWDEASSHRWEEIKQTADGVVRDFREAPLPQ